MNKQKKLSEENSKIRRQITDLIVELFKYKKGEFNTANVKYIDKFAKLYSYNAVYETFREFQSKIVWALENKSFEDDIGRIAYVFAIIENHIFDINKKLQEKPIQHIKQESVDFDSMNMTRNTPAKKKDLSQFIDEV